MACPWAHIANTICCAGDDPVGSPRLNKIMMTACLGRDGSCSLSAKSSESVSLRYARPLGLGQKKMCRGE